MRILLKTLIYIGVLVVGVYAATPLLFPYVFAKLLPSGWQLEQLDISYPGLSGFDIDKLHITGELQAGGLSLIATDGRFNYQGLKSDIKSISLDVYMRADEQSHPNMPTHDGLSLDDLSLPITKLTGDIPELSIDQLRLAIHTSSGLKTDKPLVFDIQAFRLLPDTENNFHITTNVGIEHEPQIQGQLDLDVRPQIVSANIRFPANSDTTPWMTATLEQQEQSGKISTHVWMEFDADEANQRWLDELLTLHTGGTITHINGKLMANARLAGEAQQDIEYLSLVTRYLSVEALGGSMLLDAEIQATREEEVVTVTMPGTANIEYQDRTGKIDELLKLAAPELRRSFQANAKVLVKIEDTGTFVIQPGTDSSLKFNGDMNLNISSLDNSISLEASDLQVGLADIFSLDSTTINGKFLLDWSEDKSLSYSIEDANAEALSLTADEMHIQAQLTLQDGEVLSTGDGKFINAQISPPFASVTKLDVTWQELDPINIVGQLTTRTKGFATVLEDETWTGFDFATTYKLLGNANVNGSGTVMFDSGPELPFEFAGNTQDKYWNIKLPGSTIKLAELGGILHAGHYNLPESVNLSDGYIDIRGDITVAEEITAKMTISGREMNASMLESTAFDATFSFDTSYGTTLSAYGPVSVESIALAGGIDVSQLRADMAIENAKTFSLKNFFAEVFDGQFKLAQLRIVEDRIEDTTLDLSHINLGRLLEFADITGLQGAGYLDFSLPAGSDQSGVFIKDGTFTSSGPGYLSYKNEGMAASNIGLQAMENFQYEILSGTVSYQSDGAYQIGIRLEGKNPDLYDGHPIIFNLNIGGSLPELFEALFITGDFEEAILKQIKTD